MNLEQIRGRIDQLNKLSFENILECYSNIGIPNEARLHLPSSLYDEINGLHEIRRAGMTEWQISLCTNGHGLIWTSMTEKYSEDSMRLCNNLRNIFQYERRLIETEDRIIQCLSEMPLKLYSMNNALEISMSDLESIKSELSQVSDLVIEILLIWRHSKRYDTTCKWPKCPKVESWLDAILTHSLNLWARMKSLQDTYYEVERQNGRYSLQSPFSTLLGQTAELMSRILNTTFFLEEKTQADEKYPSRFVKKRNLVTLKFCHLMGKHFSLDSEVTPAISLLNHKEVDAILANQSEYFRSPMHTSPPGILERNGFEVTKNGQLIIEFVKLSVLKPGRVRSKSNGGESVKDEKFCFLCEIVVCLRPELKIKVWTFSLPVICGTHGLQKTRSLATILWDNAGSTANRTTLDVPSEIPWSTLELALDRVHKSITNVPLSEHNKRFMRGRLLTPSAGTEMISFKSFCVDELRGCKDTTFWEWFFEGLKFGHTYFKKLWEDGYVMGFLGRDVTRQFLSTHPPGTFMIRFSESVRTAITISFKTTDGVVLSAGPFTKGHLGWKRLGEIIFELKQYNFTRIKSSHPWQH